MFREIRKKRNKIEDSAAEELLQNSRRGVLAVNGDLTSCFQCFALCFWQS